MARHLAQAKTMPQEESAERAFNKLTRTFTDQVETLKNYRSKGEQTGYVSMQTNHAPKRDPPWDRVAEFGRYADHHNTTQCN
jgi:hypothetical protein